MLIPGTTYFFRVKSSSGDKETKSKNFSFLTKGYKMVLKIIDSQGKPLKGAEVSFYSALRIGKSDEEGRVEFTDVSPGKHGLIIKYKGYAEIKELNIADSDAPQVFDIKVSTSPLPNFKPI